MQSSSKIDYTKSVELGAVHGVTALVTGSASGLGRAIAESLASNGASVALCDVNETAGRAQEQEWIAKGWKVMFVQTDASSWASQVAAFKAVLAWEEGNGRLDVVVAGAGIGGMPLQPYITASGDQTSNLAEPVEPPVKVMMVNLVGVYYTVDLAFFHMNRLAAKGAASAIAKPAHAIKPQLLIIGSLAGYESTSFSQADYAATKFGVRGLWKSVRRPTESMAPVQVNLLAPSFIRTPMIASFVDRLEAAGVKVGEMVDVVEAAMRCICDAEIEGRAVCVVKGGSFDLEDDVADHNGGRVLLDKYRTGALGNIAGSL